MSTLGVRLGDTARRLASAGIDDPRLEADVLWMTALDIDRAQLYARLHDAPAEAHAAAAEALTARRLRREPLAYVTGTREFYGLDLTIHPGVLVPRPETETLVEQALSVLSRRAGPTAAMILHSVSIIEHLQDFKRGVVDTKDVVFFLSFTFFTLFVTSRVVELRRWRR